jgi:hypothetical protein
MNRAQIIDLLMLLSALESWAMAQQAPLPEYLLADIAKEVERLRNQAMTGDDS